jgi:NhaA family Na+:H+ antiporter
LALRDLASTRAFHEFFRTEAAGGALLVLSAAAALVIANSPLADGYHRLWTREIPIDVAGHVLSLTAHQWINDGLMAVFFLLVGLEIKRASIAGELASRRQAALPVAAALGGMAVPAAIYVATAAGGDAAHGWAIPMATDIAFALGILALVAPQAPAGLKVFLAALAIVDDLGAVIVIAVFYSGAISTHALLMAGVCLLILIALNRLGVWYVIPYLVVGLALWYFVHESGVHATIAGVLLAMTIPANTPLNTAQYSARARALLDEFDRTETGDLRVLTSKGQQDAIFALERVSTHALAPLLRLEHALHRVVAFGIMPLFAFANAGVTLNGVSLDTVTLAVFAGLLIGKPLGITAATWIAVRLRVASLPDGAGWPALHGCAWLGGIGFTMSLFIATLAFGATPRLDAAKAGILAASVVAGIAGALVLRNSLNRTPAADNGA